MQSLLYDGTFWVRALDENSCEAIWKGVQKKDIGVEPVAPRTTRFLIISLERSRHGVVNHEANIGLVDPHSKSVGRHNRANLFAHEGFLHLVPSAVIQTGVISGRADLRPLENGREVVHRLTGGRVNHGESIVLSQNLYDSLFFFGVVPGWNDVVREIRPIKTGDDRLRVFQGQLASNIAANLGGCGRRQGDCRRRAERLVHLLHPEVAWPEIVPPLTDAVGFVDREERDASLAQSLGSAAEVETLRRYVEELDLAAISTVGDPSYTWLEVRVLWMNAAGNPIAVSASTWSFINEMSGETTTVRPGNRSAGT